MSASTSKATSVSEQQVQEFVGLFFRIRRSLIGRVEHALAQAQVGVNASQLQVLLRLGGGSMTAGDLAHSVGHDKGAFTRVIDQLVRKGYVQRLPHESDRRVWLIALTDAGRDVYGTLSHIRMATVGAMLQTLPDAQRAQFLSNLEKMLQSLTGPPV